LLSTSYHGIHIILNLSDFELREVLEAKINKYRRG
jgi:hypothetical protein